MARKKREEITPDLTALIDVIFQLLIFFLVSTAFKKDELSLMLNLPVTEEGKSSKVNSKQDVNIELSNSSLKLGGEEVSFDAMKQKLQATDPKTLINIRADESVVYSRIVEILDILQSLKLDNISLITKKKSAN